MLERVPAIAIKETRELLRDPIYLGLAFVIPMIMILLFGFGLILDIKHLPVAFVDRDGSPWSRDYRDRFVHSEYFDLVGVLDRRTEVEEWMRTGRARVIIDPPPEFGRHPAMNALRGSTFVVAFNAALPVFHADKKHEGVEVQDLVYAPRTIRDYKPFAARIRPGRFQGKAIQVEPGDIADKRLPVGVTAERGPPLSGTQIASADGAAKKN